MTLKEEETRPDNDTALWPSWSTPEREIEVLRAAIHKMARDVLRAQERLPNLLNAMGVPSFVRAEEQELVDVYVAEARTQVMEKRYVCQRCGAEIRHTGRLGAPCPGCGRAGTGRAVKPDTPRLNVPVR